MPARPDPSHASVAPLDLGAVALLRPFLRDGRVVTIPRKRATRRALLNALAQLFEPGRHYPEATVNAMLRPTHDDVAALRRYLVDEGLLDRDAGEYWRSGGDVEDRVRG